MTKAQKIFYVSVVVIAAVLFALGTLYDMTVAERVYQPDNFAAKLFEAFSPFVPFFTIAFTAGVIFFLPAKGKKLDVIKRVLCVIAFAVSIAVYVELAIETYSQMGFFARIGIGLAVGAALCPVILWLISKIGAEQKKKLAVYFVFVSIVYVLSSLIFVNVIKLFWSRMRYREMAAIGDFGAYTKWYKPNGFSIHASHSFPSGHAAAATGLIAFAPLGNVFEKYKGKETYLTTIAFMYTFVVAYSRMVRGAHFLSDVTGGFVIAFVTYAVVRYFYFDSKNNIRRLVEKFVYGADNAKAALGADACLCGDDSDTPPDASEGVAESADAVPVAETNAVDASGHNGDGEDAPKAEQEDK